MELACRSPIALSAVQVMSNKSIANPYERRSDVVNIVITLKVVCRTKPKYLLLFTFDMQHQQPLTVEGTHVCEPQGGKRTSGMTADAMAYHRQNGALSLWSQASTTLFAPCTASFSASLFQNGFANFRTATTSNTMEQTRWIRMLSSK